MKHRNLLYASLIAIFLILSGCAAPKSQLIQTITNANISGMQKLINEGVSVNEPDKYGITPLMYAVQYGDVEATELLIKKGANVNAKDKYGYTALIYSVTYPNDKIIKLLIDNGADVNAKDASGFTALHLAYNNYDAVKLLVDSGADINAQDSTGSTKLHQIINVQDYRDKNIPKIAKYLLDKNADTTIKDVNGWTALRYAIFYSNIDITALIRKAAKQQDEVEYLTLSEAFKKASYYKPEKGMFDVPADKEKTYEIAVSDCNLLVIPPKTTFVFVTGPIGYGASLAYDAATVPGKFQTCMAKMGFECKKNCSYKK